MLVIALVIQFVLGSADPAFYLTEHYYWMFLLLVITTKGPGPLSLDHLVARRLASAQPSPAARR